MLKKLLLMRIVCSICGLLNASLVKIVNDVPSIAKPIVVSAENGTKIVIPKLVAAPRIDGQLGNEWQQALKITDFKVVRALALKQAMAAAGDTANRAVMEKFLHELRIPRVKTEASLGYFNGKLYIAMKCFYNDRKTLQQVQVPRRDGPIWGASSIEIFIGQPGSAHRYFHFGMDCGKTLFDAKVELVKEKGKLVVAGNPKWNSNVQHAARIHNGYWIAELAIPLQDVELSKQPGTKFKLNLCRSTADKAQRYIAWGNCQKRFHEPAAFNTAFIGKIKSIRSGISQVTFKPLLTGTNRLKIACFNRNKTMLHGCLEISSARGKQSVAIQLAAGAKQILTVPLKLKQGRYHFNIALKASSGKTLDMMMFSADVPEPLKVTLKNRELEGDTKSLRFKVAVALANKDIAGSSIEIKLGENKSKKIAVAKFSIKHSGEIDFKLNVAAMKSGKKYTLTISLANRQSKQLSTQTFELNKVSEPFVGGW